MPADQQLLSDNLRVFVVPVQVLEDQELTIQEKMVYIVLRSFTNPHDLSAFPSHTKLAKLASVSVSSVKRTLKSLCEKGFLQYEQRYQYNKDSNTARQTSNLYKLSLPPVQADTPVHTELGGGSQGTGGGFTQTYQELNHLSLSLKEEEEEKNSVLRREILSHFGYPDISQLTLQQTAFLKKAEQNKIPLQMVKEIVTQTELNNFYVEAITTTFKKGMTRLRAGTIVHFPKWFLKTLDGEQLTLEQKKLEEQEHAARDAKYINGGV